MPAGKPGSTPAATAPADDVEQLRAEIAELRGRLDLTSRVLANVAARLAPVTWTEFDKLLSQGYGLAIEVAREFTGQLGKP